MHYHHANKNKVGWGIALSSLVWLLLPVANAQSDAQLLEGVRACQRVPELSARLACYDRVLPPMAESLDTDDSPQQRAARVATAAEAAPRPVPAPPPPAAVEPTPVPAAPPPAAAAPPPAPPRPVAAATGQPRSSMAQIVEVESPSLGTTRFVTADGRVFIRENARTLYRWPEPPFEVEVQLGRFGSTHLKLPSGLRVRVASRE